MLFNSSIFVCKMLKLNPVMRMLLIWFCWHFLQVGLLTRPPSNVDDNFIKILQWKTDTTHNRKYLGIKCKRLHVHVDYLLGL